MTAPDPVNGLHHEIYCPKCLDALFHSVLKALDTSHINRSKTEYFGSFPRRGDIFGHSFGLFDITPDYAGIRAKVDHGSDLGAADAACTASTKDDFIVCVV